MFLGLWLLFRPADPHSHWSTVVPTHAVEFRQSVMWLSLANRMRDEGSAMVKQMHAELAEVSLGALDATRLLLQMPAVLSTWLPGPCEDFLADYENYQLRTYTQKSQKPSALPTTWSQLLVITSGILCLA